MKDGKISYKLTELRVASFKFYNLKFLIYHYKKKTDNIKKLE